MNLNFHLDHFIRCSTHSLFRWIVFYVASQLENASVQFIAAWFFEFHVIEVT